MALDNEIISRWHNSRILLLGGSAGSFQTIFKIVRRFDTDLNKAVLIIIHRKKNFISEIEKLFVDNIRILFKEIGDKEKITPNVAYIAPSNYHVLIEKEGFFSLDVSDAVWYSKPSIDVTFDSAADVFGADCTAILFSGANPDGAFGLLQLRTKGALTIVQQPADAEVATMPQAAINLGAAQYILTAEEILELLISKSPPTE